MHMEVLCMPASRFAPDSFRYQLTPVFGNWPTKRPSKFGFRPAASMDHRHFTNQGTQTPNRMFILGTGYVGEYVAQDLINQGWVVSGTCTSVARKEKLKKLGSDVHLFDANDPELEVIDTLNQHTHLLVSVPPCKDIGDPMLQHAELLRRKLNSDCLQWLCYLSTTSVYGDYGGAWVDETFLNVNVDVEYRDCFTERRRTQNMHQQSEMAKLRLAAEEGWLSLGHDLGLAAHVFRLGGIYGPGRSAIDTLMKAEPLSDVQRARSSKKYTSRVHVADICNALNGCIQKPFPGRIYNIVDDDPAPRTQVFAFAHKLINEKWPSKTKKTGSTYESSSSTEKGSLTGEKRVINERMKKELGVMLIHPSYKAGLQAICDQIHDYPSAR